ncbi:MAG: signal peptidase II [Holosporales bacterium]|jgi:signal peptidase II|nr:signal peptidase II [Holosporales bacterium]
MTSLRRAHLFSILLGIFVVVFDQATKWSVLAFLERGTVISVCKYANIVLTYNLGTSFGLLTPGTEVQRCMIIAVSIILVAFLVYVFCKLPTIIEKVFCSLLIGGAIGNIIDRFVHGGVVDFIDVHYEDWHWPAFNIADSFITTSAVMLLIVSLIRNPRSLR